MPRSKKQQKKKTSISRILKSKKSTFKKAVVKKVGVKKAAVKKLVKKLVKKMVQKKQVNKKLAKNKSVAKFITKPAVKAKKAERMITLAELFSDLPAKKLTPNRQALSGILEESLAEVKNEISLADLFADEATPEVNTATLKEITLADLFADTEDQNDLEISLADLFNDTEATATEVIKSETEEKTEMITLADLFENFDWDKVVSEVHQSITSAEEVIATQPVAMIEEVAEKVTPTTQMFHSVAIPHFWNRPKKEPGALARLFAPQMLATVGVTMVSLFFVSLWFQSTKASFEDATFQDPALNEAWEAVKDGYHSIQNEKQKVQDSFSQLENAIAPISENNQQLQDAQDAFTQAFNKAIQHKLDQSNGGVR